MKAVIFDEPGSPARLRVADMPDPSPGEGQVRIRVAACGINPVDVKLSRAGFAGWEWPHVPGIDVVGTVDALGAGVDDRWLQKRVAAHHNLKLQGGLAELVCVDADMVATTPDGLDVGVAATVPCPGLTAYQVASRAYIEAGQRVLITGAGGAVGTFAVQLALGRGAEVHATASARDVDRLRGFGVAKVVDYRSPGVAEALADWAVDGYDAVLDLVTPGTDTAPLLRYGGVIVSTVGAPDLSRVAPFSTVPAAIENALGAVYWAGTAGQRRRLGSVLGNLLAAVAHGEMRPPPFERVALADAPTLWPELDAGRVSGKAVVVM